MTTQLLAAREFKKAIRTIDSHGSSFSGNNLYPKPSRLNHGATRQIGAGKPTRKTEVIFDAAGHAGLATRRFAFDHHCSQTLARAIHSRSESGWTTADDGEIVERFRSACFESGVFGEFRQ